MNNVTIVQTGEVQEVEVAEGTTVKQVLAEELGLNTDLFEELGIQVRVNNKVITDLDAAVNAGDLLLLVGNIAGA